MADKIPEYQRSISILLGEVVMATRLFKSNIYSMAGPPVNKSHVVASWCKETLIDTGHRQTLFSMSKPVCNTGSRGQLDDRPSAGICLWAALLVLLAMTAQAQSADGVEPYEELGKHLRSAGPNHPDRRCCRGPCGDLQSSDADAAASADCCCQASNVSEIEFGRTFVEADPITSPSRFDFSGVTSGENKHWTHTTKMKETKMMLSAPRVNLSGGMRGYRFASIIAFALANLIYPTIAAAGQFSQLAHSKLAFVGFVNEAAAKPVMTKKMDRGVIVDALGEPVSRHESHYVRALITPRRVVFGSSSGKLGDRAVSVCTDQDIVVGSSYLFFVGEYKGEKDGCLNVLAFLLGAPPGRKQDSSLVLTADTLTLMPNAPVLDQSAISLPDAKIHKNYCKYDIVILTTYMDLDNFIKLLKEERKQM